MWPAHRHLLVWAGFGLGAVFVVLTVRSVQPRDTWAAFKGANVLWLAASFAVLVVAFYIRAFRWWWLFAPPRRPRFRAVVRALFVGYLANTLLPARAGEAARTVALNRSTRKPAAEIVGTVVTERAYDVLSLVALLFLLLPWFPSVSWVRVAGVGGASLLLAVVAAAVVVRRYGERPLAPLVSLLARLPYVSHASAERAPREFVAGLAGLIRLRLAIGAIGWTALSWLTLGLSYWLAMLAFDLRLAPLGGVLVVIGIGLALILPSPPAALGVFEGATVAVLSAYSIDSSEALSYALVLHALNVLPFLAVGIAIFAQRLRRQASDTGPAPP